MRVFLCMCVRTVLCADGSGSGTNFQMLSLGLVCGPLLSMWNMFIVLCVRQTQRPPWPPPPSTSPCNLSCYCNSAWAIFLSQHLCKRYPSWRSARAKKRCQWEEEGGGVSLRKIKQTKKKKNRTEDPGHKTHVPCVRGKVIVVLCSLFNPSLTQRSSYTSRWAGLCVCNFPGAVCSLGRSMFTSTFSSHGVLICSGLLLDKSTPSSLGHYAPQFNYIFMPRPAL